MNKEASVIRCNICGMDYLESWDEEKCPHKQIADVIPHLEKAINGKPDKYMKKSVNTSKRT